MTLGTDRLEQQAPTPAATAYVAGAAAMVAAVTIVVYQAWFMPYFQSFFAGREQFARLVFYTLYGSLGLTAVAVSVTRSEIRRAVAPFAVVAAFALAATALHPIGLVTRAYIIAMAMGGTTVVLLLGSSPGTLLRLTAAVTALNSVFCFVDLLFADGFTNTLGRAAGLAINPNGAAASILLGAAASHRAVPTRFRPSFLVLTAGGLATTLSRSTMLVAIVAAAVPMGVGIWQRARTRRPLWQVPEGIGTAAFIAALLCVWLAIGAVTNSRLVPVAQAAVSDSLGFTGALSQAHDAVDRQVSGQTPDAADAAPVSAPAAPVSAPAGAAPPATSPVRADAQESPDSKRVAALTTRLSDEGHRNSTSARTLFLERALLAYRDATFFGRGLESAHPLVPHNTFVLFALAFGHLGWLIPLVLVGGALLLARDARDLPVAIVAAGTMATSHDILLTPSLFLPLAIGIGGMLAARPDDPVTPAPLLRPTIFGAIAATALFAAGCVAILGWTSSFTIERLAPTGMEPYRGAYFAYLPPSVFPGLFVPDAEFDSITGGVTLRDGATPFKRVRWNPAARPLVAPGEFAVTDGKVFFLLADRRDPRTGGAPIELGLPHAVGVPFYALLGALALWCVALIVWLRQSPRIPVVAAQPVVIG